MNLSLIILDGSTGKLDYNRFFGMNLVMMPLYCPFVVVNSYIHYYCLIQVIDKAAEDLIIPLANACEWMEDESQQLDASWLIYD